MSRKANHEGLRCIHNADIIAEPIVFAGFVSDGNFSADASVQLVAYLLQQKGAGGVKGYSGKERRSLAEFWQPKK